MSEVQFKKIVLFESDFSSVDFFRTKLAGLDFSDSIIDGITISESFTEIKGMKINTVQAVDIAKLMGLTIV